MESRAKQCGTGPVWGFPVESSFDERLALIRGSLPATSDPQARFAWLVDRAQERPGLAESDRLPQFLVPGCQVRIWLILEFRDGRCWFRMDSDAVSLKAVGGLLCDFYSGQTPVAVKSQPPEFLDDFGLAANLAESRRRTVWRLREKMRDFAQAVELSEGSA